MGVKGVGWAWRAYGERGGGCATRIWGVALTALGDLAARELHEEALGGLSRAEGGAAEGVVEGGDGLRLKEE
eukprot:3502473-Prymnesium_polylepis.1